MNENMVTISVEEYRDMVENVERFNVLLMGIYSDATLGWSGKQISFSNDIINTLMRVLDSANYGITLKKLQKESEEKKNVSDI